MKFYVVDTDCLDPYENLAREELLMEFAQKGICILFLWQNDFTIVIGRNQNPYTECRVDDFLQSGGRIARRRSGGGAVYHDKGNLNYSFIGYESEKDEFHYVDIIGQAIKKLGLNVAFNGRNDLLLDTQKFSGNASYCCRSVVCDHGTILVHGNKEVMRHYLTPEQNKMARNGVQSVSARVVNLCSFLPSLTVERVKEVIVQTAAAEVFPFAVDSVRLGKLRDLYADRDWIYGGIR